MRDRTLPLLRGLEGNPGPYGVGAAQWWSWAGAACFLVGVVGFSVMGKLAREEWRENRAFCAYCQTATLASFASVAFALPEAIRAVRHLLGRDTLN
jgi:uncharacterized membrane protein